MEVGVPDPGCATPAVELEEGDGTSLTVDLVPLCAVHFAAVAWKIDIPSGPGSIVSKLKRIDVLGALTLVGAVTLFLVGMSLGGNQLPWSAPTVWGSILVSFVLVLLFGFVEAKVAREPIMPLRVLFSRTPLGVSLTNWFISMSQFGIIYNVRPLTSVRGLPPHGLMRNRPQVPLYFSAVQQTSTSAAGLHLIPNAVLASFASLACGVIMSREFICGRLPRQLTKRTSLLQARVSIRRCSSPRASSPSSARSG